MTDIRNLLLIDENPAHAEAFREALLNTKDGPFKFEWVQTLSQSVERLREKTIWAVFASLSLPDSQGLDTIDKLLEVAPGVPILVMGGAADEDLSHGGIAARSEGLLAKRSYRARIHFSVPYATWQSERRRKKFCS